MDWCPWSEEVFQEARRAGRPIFLSIGYSTCHWCHVMAHESFEDEDVARAVELADHLLNLFFDRERGGFYPYASDGEQLLTRTKESYDGAMPSENSAAALVKTPERAGALAALAPFTENYPIPEQGARSICAGAAPAPGLWTASRSWRPFWNCSAGTEPHLISPHRMSYENIEHKEHFI